MLEIESRAHARLSPSSIARSINCTRSVQLSATVPREPPGFYAAYGTVGHAIFERCLREGLGVYEVPLGPVHVGEHVIEVDADLLQGIQQAVEWVREHLPEPRVLEQRVAFPFAEQYLDEPVWGFLDVASPTPPMTVVDLKTGYTKVSPDDPQLVMYLLGLALLIDPSLAKCDGIAGRTVVLQPFADGPIATEAPITWQQLRDFRDWLIDGMRRIKRRQYTYQDGAWCRFCPVAGTCAHLRAVAMDAALTKVVPTPEMVASGEFSADTLNAALNIIPVIEQWIKQVSAVAADYCAHGGVLEDHELKQKRTLRRWKVPEAEVVGALQAKGADPFTKPQLVTPAEAERRLPRDHRHIVAKLAEKPPGELTLARKTDARPAIKLAQAFRNSLQSRRAMVTTAAASNT